MEIVITGLNGNKSSAVTSDNFPASNSSCLPIHNGRLLEEVEPITVFSVYNQSTFSIVVSNSIVSNPVIFLIS